MAASVLIAPAHAAIVIAYCGARLLGQNDHWLVDSINYGLPLLLLFSLALLPGAYLRRSRTLLLATAIPLFVFGVFYGARFIPRWPTNGGPSSFTVMSYNVWGGNEQYRRIVEAIDDFEPEVVGLQEVNEQILGEIEQDLLGTYPYHAIAGGEALFSQFPIVGHETLVIGHEDYPLTVQYAVLDIRGERIGVINAHPHSPALMATRVLGLRLGIPSGLATMGRDLEMKDLLPIIKRLPTPLIVLGDFNLTDLHSAYGDLTKGLIDAHKQTGYGLGHTRTPLRNLGPATWRIDFIFFTPELVSNWTKTGAFGGSDHRPVVTELELLDP